MNLTKLRMRADFRCFLDQRILAPPLRRKRCVESIRSMPSSRPFFERAQRARLISAFR